MSNEFQKEKAAQEETEDVDPDVAAMMGFGGFKSSKKWTAGAWKCKFKTSLALLASEFGSQTPTSFGYQISLCMCFMKWLMPDLMAMPDALFQFKLAKLR